MPPAPAALLFVVATSRSAPALALGAVVALTGTPYTG
jgi:hypothetical protein